jgi:hypothetical protein
MSKTVSKSPDRHSFQKGGYLKRQEEKGEPVNENYLDMFDKILDEHNHKFDDPETHKNNMEYNLLTTDWILEKTRANESYAQNLYAAMCNNDFMKMEVVPILRQDPDKDYWSASWRYAGGIVADMREEGDYIDWYCSGMGGLNGDYDKDSETFEQWQARTKYVPEGCITDEIRNDLQHLGWAVVPGGDWEKFNNHGGKVK